MRRSKEHRGPTLARSVSCLATVASVHAVLSTTTPVADNMHYLCTSTRMVTRHAPRRTCVCALQPFEAPRAAGSTAQETASRNSLLESPRSMASQLPSSVSEGNRLQLPASASPWIVEERPPTLVASDRSSSSHSGQAGALTAGGATPAPAQRPLRSSQPWPAPDHDTLEKLKLGQELGAASGSIGLASAIPPPRKADCDNGGSSSNEAVGKKRRANCCLADVCPEIIALAASPPCLESSSHSGAIAALAPQQQLAAPATLSPGPTEPISRGAPLVRKSMDDFQPSVVTLLASQDSNDESLSASLSPPTATCIAPLDDDGMDDEQGSPLERRSSAVTHPSSKLMSFGISSALTEALNDTAVSYTHLTLPTILRV